MYCSHVLAFLKQHSSQSCSRTSSSILPACQQLLKRGFASSLDTQQYVAQGNTKAPPIAKTKDAQNAAKAAKAPAKSKNSTAKFKWRMRQNAKRAELAGASPKSAAAAPLTEQPQESGPAAHQQEVLTDMQAAASTAGKTGSAGKASDQDTVSSPTLENRRKQALKKARKEAAAAANKPAKQQLDEQAKAAVIKQEAIKLNQASKQLAAAAPASKQGKAQQGKKQNVPAAGVAGMQEQRGGKQSPVSASTAIAQKQHGQQRDGLPWRQQQKQWQASTDNKAKAKQAARAPAASQPQSRGKSPRPQSFRTSRPAAAAPAQPNAAEIAAAEQATRQEDARQEEELEMAVRRMLYAEKDVTDLGDEDVNLYYQLNTGNLPEAFPQFYAGSLTEDGGCKGLQDELKYTGTDRILHRSCIHSLHQKAAAEERHHLYLDGPAGCGKSIAVASLVNWARTQGWLVMYIPRATDLIEGGTFTKGEDGLWETPEVARLLLKSMVANHEQQLSEIQGSSGEPLLKMCQDGISSNKPGIVTRAAVDLVSEMAKIEQVPVLIAVDGYNVLYSHANYHEWMSEVHRRQIQPHELRLASALRILEKQGPKQGIFIGAASQSGPVSPRLQVPRPSNTLHTIPKLELAEAAQQLCHYSAQGLSEEAPEVHALEYAYFMTGGSPKGLRLHRRSLTAGQCSAEVINGMLNRYQYMLGSKTSAQSISV